jgi:predicted TIM-barrel fold metal-dependent hydrolase
MTTEIKLGAIDSDAHVVENDHTWDYMDPGEEKFRPQLYATPNSIRQHWVIDGKMCGLRQPSLTEQMLQSMTDRIGRSFMTEGASREMDDVSLRIAHMDRLGIDIQVLHNTLWISRITERPEIDIALTKSWNRWMAEVWKAGKGRLRWISVLPLTHLDTAIGMMDYAKENGAAGVAIRPFEGSRFMVDPYFHPFYEAAEKRGLPVIIHIANANAMLADALAPPYDPSGGFPTFRMPTVHACHGLLLSELPKMFPKLRWGFIESSAQWVPWIMHEVKRRVLQSGRDLPENPFNAYHVFVSAQTDDDFAYIFDSIGDDNLVIGTDYGHMDTSSEVDAIETFKAMEWLDPVSKRKTLVDNAQALYGV